MLFNPGLIKSSTCWNELFSLERAHGRWRPITPFMQHHLFWRKAHIFFRYWWFILLTYYIFVKNLLFITITICIKTTQVCLTNYSVVAVFTSVKVTYQTGANDFLCLIWIYSVSLLSHVSCSLVSYLTLFLRDNDLLD